jgi:hypothetical protein
MPVVRTPKPIAPYRAAAVPFALAVALACVRVNADETAASAAEALFREGRALIAKRDYAAACPRLEESLRLDPAPGTLFNLARCYELDGRLASAWRAYGEVAAAMAATHQRERERVARERLSEIEPRLSFLVVQLEGDPDARARVGAHVTIDDRELPASDLGQRLPVDIGEHVVALAVEGRRRREERVLVRANAETIQVRLPWIQDEARTRAADPPSAAVPHSPEPLPSRDGLLPALSARGVVVAGRDEHGLGGRRIAALTLFGSSLVAAGLGGYFGWQAFRLADESRSGCTNRGCTNGTALQEASDSHTAGDASTVSFAAAGVLAATGAILWLTGSQSVVVAPGPSPRAALWVQGRF